MNPELASKLASISTMSIPFCVSLTFSLLDVPSEFVVI
jgi:hypothetical protein